MILTKIMSKWTGYDEVLTSESGRFFCLEGVLKRFEPAPHNIIEGGIVMPVPDTGFPSKKILFETAVKTMMVPSGVKEICDGFYQRGAVTDIFTLPETLTTICRDENDPKGGAFAGCSLPEVVLPESLKFLGNYCFACSHIEKLVVRASNEAPYLRQFKDSRIQKVYLPEGQHSENTEGGGKYGFYANFFNHCKCEIIRY